MDKALLLHLVLIVVSSLNLERTSCLELLEVSINHGIYICLMRNA